MPSSKRATDYELAIVGGGPAGAATALFCVQHAPELRERIVLLDKARFPRDKICAGAIGRRADRALEAIGVSVEVPSAPVHGLCVRARRHTLSARLEDRIGRVVRRREFDAALLDHVRQRGVDVRDGVAFDGMQRFGDRVIVETSAGALSVRALVGADGVGSAVRRALGLGRGSFMAQAVEVDTDAVESDPAADLLCFDVRDRRHAGYVWDFPTLVDGDPKMCRGVYRLTRGAPPSDAPDIAALLSDHLSGLGLHPDPKRYKRFAERGLSLWQATGGDRVLLVGEAAGIDPVLGEGIAQAILHGQTAGAYLARCWRAQHYGFEDYRRTLRASRVGLDLRVRAMLVNFVYDKTRPWCERWVTGSRALAHAGMQYFAGERVSRPALARAALDLPLSLIGAI